MPDPSSLRPRKPVALGSFLLVVIVATAVFVPTLSAHVAVMNESAISATPTEYALSEDRETLLVTIRIENPTRSTYEASYAQVSAWVNGTRVTQLSTLDGDRIPSGESGTVTARLGLKDGTADEVAAAIESGSLTSQGDITGTIMDEEVHVFFGEVETDG